MREDQANVTVTLDGAPLGTWDKLSGGSVDSEEIKFRPGGMQATYSLGGFQTFENVTVSRNYRQGRDSAIRSTLKARAGKGVVTVSRQDLDINGVAFGQPEVWTGVLKQVSTPDHNSESNDAEMIELEISVESTA